MWKTLEEYNNNNNNNVQEIEIWPYEQIAYAHTRIRHRKWDVENSLGFWDTKGLTNLGQITGHCYSQKQKKKKKKKKNPVK